MLSLKPGFASPDADQQLAGGAASVGTKIDLDNEPEFDDSEDLFAESAAWLGPFASVLTRL